jgi:hypothetical protein
MSPQAWIAFKCKALDLAEIIDAHRVFPKVFVFGYGAICWHMTLWYEGLDDPTTQQAAFVTTVVGIFAPLFKWYADGGRKWT